MANEDRPQYQHGVGTIGGTQFHWGSGSPGQYWSIPYGDYPVTPNAPTGAWAHQVGAIPISNNVIPDPVLHRDRIGIMIHSGSAPDLDHLYTQGCFKVAPQEWPAVRAQILSQAEKGSLYLHVAPGGVASFTNTKTLSQAGSDTPAASANAVANTTTTPQPLATPGSNPFYGSLTQIESGNRNIPSQVDKDYPGQPGSKSQGYAQIDTPTWQQFGAKAGIDLNRYPNAMSAPPEIQQQVAYQIPLSRFGGQTQTKLAKQYGQLDTGKTVGELAQQFGGANSRGTTLTSSEPGIGSGYPTPATPNATAVAAETPSPQNVGDWIKKIATRPEPTKDAQGNDVPGKSPLEKLAGAIPGKPAGQQGQPAAPDAPTFAPVQDPMAQMADPAGRLLTEALTASAKPLSWSSMPYGSNAGQRMPGTTLNTTGYPYG